MVIQFILFVHVHVRACIRVRFYLVGSRLRTVILAGPQTP